MKIGVSHVISMHFPIFLEDLENYCLRCVKKPYSLTFSVSFLMGPVRTFDDLSFGIIDNDLPLIIIHIKATGFMQFLSLI